MTLYYRNGRLIGDEKQTAEFIMKSGLAKDFIYDYLYNYTDPEAIIYEIADGGFYGTTQNKLVNDGLYHIKEFEVSILGFSSTTKFPGYFDRKGKKAASKPLISFRRK